MLFRAIVTTLLLIILAVLVMILYFVVKGDVSSDHPAIEYKDFVSILLTALGVMMAVAAVIAAFAAIFGMTMLKEEAQKAARAAAVEEPRATVPRLVEEAVEFAKQGAKAQGDKVADEYSRGDGPSG